MTQRIIFWFFLGLLCLQRIAGKSAENQVNTETVRDECSSSNLKDQVSKLEAKDNDQEKEISNLKTTVHQLMGKVAKLEATGDDVITNSQQKRPARLLPSKFLWY